MSQEAAGAQRHLSDQDSIPVELGRLVGMRPIHSIYDLFDTTLPTKVDRLRPDEKPIKRLASNWGMLVEDYCKPSTTEG